MSIASLELKLARVRVKPHVRKVGGKLVPVAGYVRDSATLPKLGDCYTAALEVLIRPPKGFTDLSVIHATVTGRGPLNGVRFGHAWVEGTSDISGVKLRFAIDRSNQNRDDPVIIPAGAYRNLAQADDIHEYTAYEAARLAIETEQSGPWHEDEVAADT